MPAKALTFIVPIVHGLLWVLSKPYECVILLRNRAYDTGLLGRRRAAAPVISVGNITVGGTGKTPFVIWLTRRLLSYGWQPAVLSRGYGPRNSAGLNDENTMLKRRISAVEIIEDPNRRRAAELAVRQRADVLVMDDGFQHRRLDRDMDIVLLDATRPFGGGHLLPRGRLREPAAALRRADMVVITRCDLVENRTLQGLKEDLAARWPHTPVYTSLHRPESLQRIAAVSGRETSVPLHELTRGAWAGCCAIGNPDAFRQTLQRCGADIGVFHAFRDHHRYRPEDIQRVVRNAHRHGCRGVVMTEKDAVKIMPRDTSLWDMPLFYLRIVLEVPDGHSMMEHIQRTLLGYD